MADVVKLKSKVSKSIRKIVEEQCDGNVSRFAEKTGHHRVSVHEWLTGSKVPSVESVVTICEKFNIESKEILGV